MMTKPTPSDYSAADGWCDVNGIEQCPKCNTKMSANAYLGPVYSQQGTRYEHILETPAGEGPYFCESCWKVLIANKNAIEHRTLDNFGGQ